MEPATREKVRCSASGCAADSIESHLFRRDLGEAAALMQSVICTERTSLGPMPLPSIECEASAFIGAIRMEQSSIDESWLWGMVFSQFVTKGFQERFGITEIELSSMIVMLADNCIRSSIECSNPENSMTLMHCADMMLKEARDGNLISGNQDNLCRWKIATAGRALQAVKQMRDSAIVLNAAKRALKECSYEPARLDAASAALESAILGSD